MSQDKLAAATPLPYGELVTVRRDDLVAVYGYAQHFDVDDDPAVARIAKVIAGFSATAFIEDPGQRRFQVSAREHLAWLMWCYQEGYSDPADRASLDNWMADDPAILHDNDVKAQRQLLAMADEVLSLVAQEAQS